MNKACITGRLGEKAEVIQTKNNNIMVKLIVATRDRDETDWHQVKIIRPDLAQTCQKCPKGQIVSISGKIKTKKFIDSKGVTHYSTFILADEVNFHSPLNPDKRDQQG